MLKLALDLDGVLFNFMDGMNRILNEIRPGSIPPGFVPSSYDGWVDSGLVTHDEYRTAWGKIRDTPDFWRNLKVYYRETIDLHDWFYNTQKQNYEEITLTYLTSRFSTGGVCAEWQSIRALENECLPRGSVIVVPRAEAKLPICKAMRFTAILEDRLDMVYDLRCAGLPAFLLHRPWNDIPCDFEDSRVHSVRQFLERAETLAKVDSTNREVWIDE